MDVEGLASELQGLAEQAKGEMESTEGREDLIQVKNRYLGRKGRVQELMKTIGRLPSADRPQAGAVSNRCKAAIEEVYEQRMAVLEERALRQKLERERVDVTLPARRYRARHGHPLEQVQREIIDIFREMGFSVATGPECETDWHNFEALNFPPDHPARDMQDTFVLSDGRVLRTHTSPVQVRTMLAYAPPICIIAPGRVYRSDNDITHSPVFHQVEGLLVDRHINFSHLKGTLQAFTDRYFGEGTPMRFRASFFPFTEPSAEVDIGCVFCKGEGCRVCKETGWIEVLGCGMVDPNVFEHCQIDRETFSGFAFGIGVERIAMLRYGIDDIRLFYENEISFLSQFSD